MSFQATKIKEVAVINPDSVGRNFSHKSIEYIDISSVGTGVLLGITELDLLSAPSRAKRLVQPNDIILSTVRPNRRSFYYFNKTKDNTVVSTGFAVLRAKNNNNPRYLYYSITNQFFTDYLTNNAKGAAYPAVDSDIIYKGEILVPEKIEDQNKIASVLTAYDDLIENNERRIKILEEMAQLLYTEWFVKFKFPGHKKGKLVDSGTEFGIIPEGWEVKKLNDVAEVVSGYPFKSSTYVKAGKYKIVTIKNVHDGRFVQNYDSFIDTLPVNLPEKCILANGDILLSLTGNVGRVCVVYGRNHLLNQRVARLKPAENNYREFVYYMFRQINFQKKLESISNGAAQQNLSPIQVKDTIILLPKIDVLKAFSSNVEKHFNLMIDLLEENKKLASMRDLLIPQLVTGKRELK